MAVPSPAVATADTAALIDLFKAELGAVLDVDPEFIDDSQSLPELGADSLRLISLAVRLKPVLGFTLPPGLLPLDAPVSVLVQTVADALNDPNPLAALSRLQRERLRAEIEADLFLIETPPSNTAVSAAEARDPRAVFLTGATGFLGAYLVRSLADHTSAKIHCLVRAGDVQAALDRLKDNLGRFQLWTDDLADRIEIELGELGPDRFGLAEERFAHLADTLDIIYHNGAAVHLTQSYAQVRAANVAGTRVILELAARGRVKPVAVVSTVGLLDTPELEDAAVITEAMTPQDVTLLPNGYTQSKLAGEWLVTLAASRGVPAASLRVGHVIGDGVSEDLAGRLAQACFLARAVPHLAKPIDYVPPDYVADAIVALPRDLAAFSGVYHLVNPNPLGPDDVGKLLAESPEPLDVLSVNEWLTGLRAAALNDPAHPLFSAADLLGDGAEPEGQSFVEQVLARPRIACDRVRAVLPAESAPCPPAREILRGVLERMPEIRAMFG